MGSLNSRSRPMVPSTTRPDVQMLRMDQTVVMEVRGRQMELQTKTVDCTKTKHHRRQRRRRQDIADGVDVRCQGTVVESTANHVSSSSPEDQLRTDSGPCTGRNNGDMADDYRSSAESKNRRTTETTNTETTENR